MTGTTLIVNEPLRGYAASHIEPPSLMPWAGGPRRTFERADVVAIGKLRRYNDFVTRYVVRLRDGAEVQVTGTEQSEDDRKWLTKLAGLVKYEQHHLPKRDAQWTIAWYELPQGDAS